MRVSSGVGGVFMDPLKPQSGSIGPTSSDESRSAGSDLFAVAGASFVRDVFFARALCSARAPTIRLRDVVADLWLGFWLMMRITDSSAETDVARLDAPRQQA